MSKQEVGHVAFAVSGASGAVGGRVATRLASLGHGQRLIVRDRSRAPDLPRAQASYDDPQAMQSALAGVETFFIVSAGEAADRGRADRVSLVHKRRAGRHLHVCQGPLVFTGTRVPAKTLVDYIKAGHTLDDFLEGFPTVRREAAEAYLKMTLEAADDLARSAR